MPASADGEMEARRAHARVPISSQGRNQENQESARCKFQSEPTSEGDRRLSQRQVEESEFSLPQSWVLLCP